MKLKSLKKSEVAQEIEGMLCNREPDWLLTEKECEDLTLFMEKKREIETKSDK